MPEGFVASQPVQMFMMTPMTAPVMTSMPGLHDFPNMDSMPYGDTYAAPVPFSWSAQNQWFPLGENFILNDQAPHTDTASIATAYAEPPMQTAYESQPMQTGFPEAAPMQTLFADASPMQSTDENFLDLSPHAEHYRWETASQAGDWQMEENVPPQIQMEMTSQQVMDDTQLKADAASSCTLRRRRKKGSSQDHMVECSQDVDVIEAEPEAETDLDAAQAREMANDLLEKLQLGGRARQLAVASFEKLSFTNTTTSRAAQIALKEASSADAVALAKALRNCVRNAVQSKHANYVIQQITEIMPAGHAKFIVEELKGFGRDVARHRFGCRVLCRILEHLAPQDDGALKLVDEALEDTQDLCSHEFGSFVARHLLEFGTPQHKHRVASALGSDLYQYSKHKLGSHVVESALRLCSPEDQRALARQLMSDPQQLLSVAANQYGRHVVRALLGMTGESRKEAVGILLPMEQKLKSLRYGKSVLSSLRAASTN
jgi:hypothetical protein